MTVASVDTQALAGSESQDFASGASSNWRSPWAARQQWPQPKVIKPNSSDQLTGEEDHPFPSSSGKVESPGSPPSAAGVASTSSAPRRSMQSAGSSGSGPNDITPAQISIRSSLASAVSAPTPIGKRTRKSMALTKMLDLDDDAQDNEEADITRDWGVCRKQLFKILTMRQPPGGTVVFDAAMGVVILVNIALMIPETDWAAACELEDPEACIPQWVHIFNHVLLALYTIEFGMRLFVYRSACFYSPWTMLDMAIVGIGLLGVALASVPELKRVNILRILRVARILRFIRILKRFPTLCNIIGGFVGAMHAMAWGILMILLLLVAWSLFAVEFINPINKRLNGDERCASAFQSVLSSTLLFFQTLVAGDSWGACAIPIIEDSPWTYGIFAGALVTVQLGFTNLVLAIIVDKAAEAREGSKEEQRAQRVKQQYESFEMWRGAMKELDADESGSISEQELMEGYTLPRIKETLEEMNITKNDLRSLFHLMDHDHTGQLSYHQFLESFYKAQVQDPKIYLMVMQLRMQKIETQVSKNYEACMRNFAGIMSEAMVAMGHQPLSPEALLKKCGVERPAFGTRPVAALASKGGDTEFASSGTSKVWY